MKKIFIILLSLSLILPSLVMAKPLSKKQEKALMGHETLRDQMSKMIISIADLDILINRDNVIDYEIFQADAERILAALKKIKEMDPENAFTPFLNKLEKPTIKLLELSKKQDPKAAKYPKKIFNACFKCHQAHRNY
jgi:hypothetical protein